MNSVSGNGNVDTGWSEDECCVDGQKLKIRLSIISF